MGNIADLEYSADANSGMRQTKNFFLHILVHLITMRRGVYWTNLLGGPKVPLRLYTDDNKKGCLPDQPPWGP